jgi:RNA polymerase sigma-70 factor (ECF subfamily)
MAVLMTGMGSSIHGEGAFPETLWSSILSAPDPNSPERRERLQKLLQSYWKPVFKSIRRTWKTNIEDAKDLTQEFFAHVLEVDLVGKYKPHLGRFRSFLRASLRLFLAEQYRDRRRIKRGGAATIIPLDVGPETGSLYPDDGQITPEEYFDREWAEAIVEECVGRMRERLRGQGKEVYFRVYEAYYGGGEEKERPTYPEIAKALGLQLHDVRNYLTHTRAMLKELLVERVREYVAGPQELAGELNELMALFKR